MTEPSSLPSGVLVTVTQVDGSAPRAPGAKMLVTADGLHGTIGGGRLEHEATTAARKLLAEHGGPCIERVALGPRLGQCCGGAVVLCFEPTPTVTSGLLLDVAARDIAVVVFGAGHVGRALATILGTLPCAVTWIDERAGQHPPSLPENVQAESVDEPEDCVQAAPPGASFVVVTHSHQRDLAIVEQVLRRGDFAYLGMIGSTTKRRRFEQRLRARGLSDDQIARLRCPIGSSAVRGKHPGIIAVAIAAELLQVCGGA